MTDFFSLRFMSARDCLV